MCGISGEIRLDGGAPDAARVERMTNSMIARGPDAGGVWTQGRVALGHRRLKIIDLSERGQQPMVDPDLGLTVVFNGCIYNYEALRSELEGKGYRFFSSSDTEVILKAYDAWGTGCVDRFNGMFAFCIVERDSGRAILARDRLGIKPLYVAESSDAILFASSLRALVATGDIDTRIDPVALHHYMTFHSVVPAPHTIFRGVRKVPPATITTVEPDGTTHRATYWSPSFTRDESHAGWSATDWSDAVLASLRAAVKRRLVADVPVGVLLSGGLDSSLVVGLLAEEGQTGLKTFSVGFEAAGGEEGDEFRYSDVIAERFATDHHQIRVPNAQMLTALRDAIGAMSEPMVSHDVVGFYLLSQRVSEHVKVVQSGQGADEIFAGYHWYPPMMGASDALGTYADSFFDRTHEQMAQIVAPDHLPATDESRAFVAEHFAAPGAETPADRALRIDTQIMLIDDPVKRVDNMTMAWGLEARVPFLDHELVELAAACPPELKVAGGGKGVLKEAARAVIPADVIDRPKGYFPVPALKYIEGDTLDMVRDALTASAARERGLFQRAAVEALLAAPNDEHTPLRGNKLWQIGALELWLQDILGENR